MKRTIDDGIVRLGADGQTFDGTRWVSTPGGRIPCVRMTDEAGWRPKLHGRYGYDVPVVDVKGGARLFDVVTDIGLGEPSQGPLRFHDPRNPYATWMLEANEELTIVSRTLGHASLSTTADIYGHITPTTLERSAVRMDDIQQPSETK
jgi:integrase